MVAVKSSHATFSLIHIEYPLKESSAEKEPDLPDITFSLVGSKSAAAAPPTIITIPIAVIIPPMINNTLPAVCIVKRYHWRFITILPNDWEYSFESVIVLHPKKNLLKEIDRAQPWSFLL